MMIIWHIPPWKNDARWSTVGQQQHPQEGNRALFTIFFWCDFCLVARSLSQCVCVRWWFHWFDDWIWYEDVEHDHDDVGDDD